MYRQKLITFFGILLFFFIYKCESTEVGRDHRVDIVLQECANATLNTNNLFAVCGVGSVNDPFRIVHEQQLIRLSDPADSRVVAWLATACDGGRCNFKLIDNLNMDGMTLVGPIGTAAGANSFNANFDGNDKTISNLTVNLPAMDNVGLFGYIEGAEIKSLGLVNVNVAGRNIVGSLIGHIEAGIVRNSYVSGVVSGTGDNVGGLAGGSNISTIGSSYAMGNVTGIGVAGKAIGGLLGFNRGTLTNSYATGMVTAGGSFVGGLVGQNETGGGAISNSYSTSLINGNDSVSGLVGWSDGNVRDSYATGSVTGISNTSGLVGNNAGGMINGINYFVDMTDSNGGGDGVGNGTCGPGTCTQQGLADIRDTLNEGAAPLNWDAAIWGALGETGSFPCLRNMPSDARSCP